MKFVSQNLTFLQPSVVTPTFRNPSSENNYIHQEDQFDSQTVSSTVVTNSTTPTQVVKPVLGFTPAEIQQAVEEPELTVKQLLGLSSCKGYVQTPLRTLDGIDVNQPSHFLPLVKEAKKLAEELQKEQQAAQWVVIPPEKLLQESFVEQLNAIQILEQLALLDAAREHLPQDIINILELLGKADNIPLNQLYNLAQDCADCYCTEVIKTLIDLLKCNFMDRQTVLVNTARALKFLETYGDQRAKLWKILSKYDGLPEHFHHLQTTLHTELIYLKQDMSKNIEHLQSAINLQ